MLSQDHELITLARANDALEEKLPRQSESEQDEDTQVQPRFCIEKLLQLAERTATHNGAVPPGV